MTPEIIEFYVENPGLVTREVKQLLIALSDCYDVAKRYTGIFCKIAIDEDKIEKYGGGGGSDITDNACKKLLEEKKMGRFNKELNVDNGCGGGNQKREPVKNYAKEIERLKLNTQYTLIELIEYVIYLDELNKASDTIGKYDREIKMREKEIDEMLKKDYQIKENEISLSNSSDQQPPLMFLENCIRPFTCWIDSLLYFLYGISNIKNYDYYMKEDFGIYFLIAYTYLTNSRNKNNCLLIIDNKYWNEEFLQRLLPQKNEYNKHGFNDLVKVLENILGTIVGNTTLDSAPGNFSISQLIYPDHEPIDYIKATQNNFYNLFYEATKIGDLKNNFLFQTCAGRRLKADSKYKSLLLPTINIPIFLPAKNFEYELKSFIVHKGGNHYVCYFNYDGQWWYYNDLAKNFTKEGSLEDISTKIENSKTYYIVLYNYKRVEQT
jgi:hypothetical protein